MSGVNGEDSLKLRSGYVTVAGVKLLNSNFLKEPVREENHSTGCFLGYV